MEAANAQNEPTTQSLPPPPGAARRTPSFSSSDSSFGSLFSSSSSSSDQFPPFSPSSNKGIPFSWEQTPGIPKHQISNRDQPSGHHLPLPPAGNPIPAKKTTTRADSDPFIAALMACSKDNHDDEQGIRFWREGFKITRSLSDRFGFISMYTSCKRTCAVSESLVYLPRSTSPHYVNLNRPSRSDHHQ